MRHDGLLHEISEGRIRGKPMRGRRRNKVLHDLAHYDGYVGQQRTDGGTEKDIKNLLYSRRLLTMMLLPDVGKSLTLF